MYAVTFEKNGQTESLAPDELANEDEIAYEVSSITKLTLLIYPQFSAWGFPEKQTTVTLLDIDTHSVVFYGRVTDIQDSMDNSGKYCRRITCANEMDFLDDTRTALTLEANTYAVSIARTLIEAHNTAVGSDSSRHFQVGDLSSIAHKHIKNNLVCDYCTTLDALKKVFVELFGVEIRTRHVNGVNYFEVGTFGTHSDTSIIIGDNLKQIRATYSAADKLVTRLIPLGGTGYDGKRLTIEQAADNTSHKLYIDNAELVRKHGIHEGTLVINELAPQWSGQIEEMAGQLYEIGLEEAAALGTPAVQIALSASDLQKLGYAGYDGFELGNTHYTVCPKLGIFRDLRITGLKRRLTSPANVDLTITTPTTTRREIKIVPLSKQIAEYNTYYEEYISDVDRKQTEQTQKKLDLRLDKLNLKKLTQEEYDIIKEAGELDDDTIYTVVSEDPQTGETKVEQYLGAAHITTEGGGGDEGIPYPQQADLLDDPDSVTGFAAEMSPLEQTIAVSWSEGGLTTYTDSETGKIYVTTTTSNTRQHTGFVSMTELIRDGISHLTVTSETASSDQQWWGFMAVKSNMEYINTYSWYNFGQLVSTSIFHKAAYIRLFSEKAEAAAVRQNIVKYRL
jgi:hypothetical protein